MRSEFRRGVTAVEVAAAIALGAFVVHALVPDEGSIAHKPGPLDAAEWAFVRRHTVVGERIVSASPALRRVGRIVRSSYERWDGTGYPDRLVGAEIPLAARIVFACDAFSAMTTSRAYRDAMSADEALRELELGSRSQFDPEVAGILVAVVHERFTVGAPD